MVFFWLVGWVEKPTEKNLYGVPVSLSLPHEAPVNGNILSVPPKSGIIYKPAEDAFCPTVWIHNNTEQYQSQPQALKNGPTSFFLPAFWLIYSVHISPI